MAGAATVSAFITLTLGSSLSSSPNYSFPPPQSLLLSNTINPTLTCHAKLGTVEEPEEINGGFFDDGELIDDESDEEEDTESSVDLLFRLFQSMFKKVSARAKKASRSILPSTMISPQLVSFAVDGVFLLASLSIAKALLEVVCTLGGTVFMAILLIRVIWAAVSYFQSNGNNLNHSGTSYNRAQPVT